MEGLVLVLLEFEGAIGRDINVIRLILSQSSDGAAEPLDHV